MVSATGKECFVVDGMCFSVGELRTSTWKVTRPTVGRLVGHLMASTEGDSPVRLISPAK